MSTYTHRPPELSRLGLVRFHLGQAAKQFRSTYWQLRIVAFLLLGLCRKRTMVAPCHEVTAAASQQLSGRNVLSDINSLENVKVMATPLAGASVERGVEVGNMLRHREQRG